MHKKTKHTKRGRRPRHRATHRRKYRRSRRHRRRRRREHGRGWWAETLRRLGLGERESAQRRRLLQTKKAKEEAAAETRQQQQQDTIDQLQNRIFSVHMGRELGLRLGRHDPGELAQLERQLETERRNRDLMISDSPTEYSPGEEGTAAVVKQIDIPSLVREMRPYLGDRPPRGGPRDADLFLRVEGEGHKKKRSCKHKPHTKRKYRMKKKRRKRKRK